MIKLLLLTAFSLTSSFPVFAADPAGLNAKTINMMDSSIKEEIIVNPRDGFKNLFESSAANSNFDVKLNPMAVTFVQDYMDDHSAMLNKMKSWGKPYFDMMDDVLAKHGLPTELKYLSVIESQLKSTATSWAGAVGPWQFMPETARLLGLKVGKGKDERTDYFKSTQAAARYLTELYGIFNDWLLVIAAYNCGPGNVLSAIKRSGTNNFWELQRYLPTESRNHVKKFIATHYIMEGQGGLTTLTKKETDNYMISTSATVPVTKNIDTEVVSVNGKYNSIVIAQLLQINIADFNRLNPGFDKQMAMGNSYNLRLPADKALQFQAQKPQILEQSIRLALTMASTKP